MGAAPSPSGAALPLQLGPGPGAHQAPCRPLERGSCLRNSQCYSGPWLAWPILATSPNCQGLILGSSRPPKPRDWPAELRIPEWLAGTPAGQHSQPLRSWSRVHIQGHGPDSRPSSVAPTLRQLQLTSSPQGWVRRGQRQCGGVFMQGFSTRAWDSRADMRQGACVHLCPCGLGPGPSAHALTFLCSHHPSDARASLRRPEWAENLGSLGLYTLGAAPLRSKGLQGTLLWIPLEPGPFGGNPSEGGATYLSLDT